MLRKKAVALAVAGALGVPIAAVAQNVQIYGKVYPEFNNVKGSGATAAGTGLSTIQKTAATGLDNKARNEVEASNTRLGFRGSEDLGSGLKAIWQIENKVSIDTGGTTWASRNSFGGLAGGFGTVKLGNMDTIYKELGDQLSFLGVSSGNFVSASSVLSKPGIGTSSSSSFHLRRANSAIYESPSFGGVQFLITYSPDELKTATKDARLTSYGVRWTSGGLYLALAHEDHKDFFGGSNNAPAAIANPTTGTTGVHSDDTATRGTVIYTFGDTKVSFDLAQLEWKETGGAAGHFESYKNRHFAANVQQKFGNIVAQASYIRANAGTCTLAGGAACSTSGLDGSQLNLGAAYNLSRRTYLFALYSRLTNGESATFNNSANLTVSPGEDITQFGAGVAHSF